MAPAYMNKLSSLALKFFSTKVSIVLGFLKILARETILDVSETVMPHFIISWGMVLSDDPMV